MPEDLSRVFDALPSLYQEANKNQVQKGKSNGTGAFVNAAYLQIRLLD